MDTKKKVLILMAEKTGSGHKSAANALKNAISEKNGNIETVIFNAMTLMGKTGLRLENSYNKLTTKTPLVWKLIYESTNIFNRLTNYFIFKFSHKRFKKLVDEIKPDLIISVHPMFNNSIVKALKKYKLKLPFFVYIIDLVKISKLWRSKKADMTFCPTEKVYNTLLKKRFEKKRLLNAGFPINSRFAKPNGLIEKEYTTPKVLMVSPSVKNKKTLKFASALADNFNVDLTVVAGTNAKLYGFLQKSLKNKNVKILNYVNDMPDRLTESDVIITKAGPNIMLEAVRMSVPVIVTGHILGQEEKNYRLITDNEYGLKCESAKKLKKIFEEFEKDNYQMLNLFRKNEISSSITDGASIAADYIIDYLNK